MQRNYALSIVLTVTSLGCGGPSANQPVAEPTASAEPAEPEAPTAEEARAFVARVNEDLRRLATVQARAEWIKSTYITYDTQIMAARANEALMAYTSQAIAEARRFDGLELDEDTARQLHLLTISQSLPAPNDAEKRRRLAQIAAELEGLYGRGKYCTDPEDPETCRDLQELSNVLAESRDYDDLLEAWNGWRTISPPMRSMYQEFVALGNEGAREIGFDDLGELWRAGYDMTPAEFDAEVERLWEQVAPLYEQLHCYVRAKLSEHYGAERVPPNGPIPAHLLGNMWAQSWENVFPLVQPYETRGDIDVSRALQRGDYSSRDMVRMGERFFTSLGLAELPDTFWERSMFDKPEDRDVVCHASAWDVDYDDDLRIKMCIQINDEDFITIHHELGHNYYYRYYYELPILYQSGAHDGFHEGIGDTLALSVTPSYLSEIGVLENVQRSEQALINLQMKEALAKIAFLPFGKMIDQWRWRVFSGEIPPESYNEGWWELRQRYQGIAPPNERSEELFDPGAKFHVPGNTPYTRYFLAHILQFQFHRALCREAGHEGPLHECSIYGSTEAGEKLRAMLAMGASRPWPDALEAIAGERTMDASALVEYFAPLLAWIEEQNEGRTCGW